MQHNDRPRAGEICWHSSEAEGGPDIGIEVGLTESESLYVGELSRETLIEAGVSPEVVDGVSGAWVSIVDDQGIRVLAFTASTQDGDEARDLVYAIANAIAFAKEAGKAAGCPQLPSPPLRNPIDLAALNAAHAAALDSAS